VLPIRQDFLASGKGGAGSSAFQPFRARTNQLACPAQSGSAPPSECISGGVSITHLLPQSDNIILQFGPPCIKAECARADIYESQPGRRRASLYITSCCRG